MPNNPEVEMLRSELLRLADVVAPCDREIIESVLATPAPKQKLRPMSEAPRDGQRIMLYFELDDASTGHYCKPSFPADDPWVVGRDTYGDHDFIGWLPLPEVEL